MISIDSEKNVKILKKDFEKTVSYLSSREAFSKERSIYLEDDDVRIFLEKSLESVPFVSRENGRYWIDMGVLETYIKQRKTLRWVNRVVFLIIVVGIFIYILNI
jgi:hypothetical protein